MSTKPTVLKVLPILLGFYALGFTDIIGAATKEIKDVLNLSSTMAALLPNSVYIWALFVAVPAGLLIRRIGRKTSLQVGYVLTLAGLAVPLPMLIRGVELSFGFYLFTFCLMGIGHTVIQVVLNPLLTNVVNKERLASNITLGQSIKAVSSMLGPQIIFFCTRALGNWNWAFSIYMIMTLISILWLGLTQIPREERATGREISFKDSFVLLKDSFLLRMLICIMLIVGVDVGLNFFIPRIFSSVYGYKEPANMNTVYFACRTVSSFVCAMMLVKIPPRKILMTAMLCSIAACAVMTGLSTRPTTAIAPQVLFISMLLPIAFTAANVFSIIFSLAIKHCPEKSDEIASLLIMGIAGGGTMTLLIGMMDDAVGIVGGLAVLLTLMVIIFFVVLSATRKVQNS